MVDTEGARLLLGVSKATLYRLVKSGDLTPANANPVLSRPQQFKFRVSDLEALKQRGRRPRKAQQGQ